MAWGSFDSASFDRARIYGVADSLRWALIRLFADAVKPDTTSIRSSPTDMPAR